jgi:putative transposase
MARLPRLALAGHAHYLILRAHGSVAGRGVFADAADRHGFLSALHEAAAAERVQVHAYALLPAEVQLLATPPEPASLGRLMQALGRRYVSAYNRRHGHSGSLWDGRFRCAVVEPGATRLAVLRLIDGQSIEPGITSAGHRRGGARDAGLADLPEVWQLGNTPFDREAAYRDLLEHGLPTAQAESLRRAALGGWAAGSPAFTAEVAATASRPARPRTPGRPRRSAP